MTVSWNSFANLAAGAWLDVAKASFSAASSWGQNGILVTDYTVRTIGRYQGKGSSNVFPR